MKTPVKTKLILSLALASILCCEAKADSLTNGLVAYYTFQGNANDLSGNGNNATPAGNFQYVTGYGIHLTGDNSQFYAGGGYVTLPTFGSQLDSGFSASLWVKDEVPGSGPTDSECYLSFQDGPDASDFCTQIQLVNRSPPFVAFFNGNGGGANVSFYQTIDLVTYPNSWKQLVVVTASNRFSCYFNGSKIYEANVSYSVFPAPLAALGRHWWTTGSSARMSATYANVRIYNRALSDSEVQSLYLLESPLVLNIYTAIELGFATQSNQLYQIQASPDLVTWTNFDAEIQGTGSNWFKTYSIRGQPQLYYRVLAAPNPFQ